MRAIDETPSLNGQIERPPQRGKFTVDLGG
jgi:hypothetical protein